MHETIDIYNPLCERNIPIDKNIAPLLTLMWKHGIRTKNCCEDSLGKPGYVWIEFLSSIDFNKFAYIVLTTESPLREPDIHNRVKDDIWIYKMCCNEIEFTYGIVKSDENDDGEIEFMSGIYIDLLFPKSDYETIYQQFVSFDN
jgi:hypothetical protein